MDDEPTEKKSKKKDKKSKNDKKSKKDKKTKKPAKIDEEESTEKNEELIEKKKEKKSKKPAKIDEEKLIEKNEESIEKKKEKKTKKPKENKKSKKPAKNNDKEPTDKLIEKNSHIRGDGIINAAPTNIIEELGGDSDQIPKDAEILSEIVKYIDLSKNTDPLRIPDNERTSYNKMTTYERAKIIGNWAEHVALTNTTSELPLEIAKRDFKEKKIRFLTFLLKRILILMNLGCFSKMIMSYNMSRFILTSPNYMLEK
jgi:flagellar biosynthesis GTPase FlhF